MVAACAGFVTLALALSGCRAGPPADLRPHVFLISLDTLRRDALELFRGDRPAVAPNLDQLVRESLVFTQAFVQIPYTLPSHMSMFTGLYPEAHGVLTKKTSLPAHIPTLPQLLEEQGYATHGLVSSKWLKEAFGFGRGFEEYRKVPYGWVHSPQVTRAVFESLDRRPTGDPRPLFYFLHYYDAHSDTLYHGNKLPYYVIPELRQGSGDDELCDAEGNCATQYLIAANRDYLNDTGRKISAERLARLVALYEGGIRGLDRDLGALFGKLKQLDLYDRSMIIVTSDHGEEFLEHGSFLHRQAYAETIAVPLIVKFPVTGPLQAEHAGETRDGLVESIDILPTILDYLDLPAVRGLQGRSVLPMIASGRPTRRYAISRDKSRKSRYGLRTREHTLIHDLRTGISELYDLEEDPGERRDLSAERPQLVVELTEQLLRLTEDNARLAESLRTDRLPEAEVLSAAEKAELKSLGYLD